MFLKKSQISILIFNMIYLGIAFFVFVGRANYEFIMYIGVILFFFFLILITNKKIDYPNFLLWGLSLWGLLHMLGGGFLLEDGRRLYELILIPLSSNYPIFRYDQFVHIIGFGVATILMWILIKPSIKNYNKKWVSISIVLAMGGLGVGAFNELVEFLAVVIMPETGVGGFLNVSLDLVADLIGATFAIIYIKLKKGKI